MVILAVSKETLLFAADLITKGPELIVLPELCSLMSKDSESRPTVDVL